VRMADAVAARLRAARLTGRTVSIKVPTAGQPLPRPRSSSSTLSTSAPAYGCSVSASRTWSRTGPASSPSTTP
jgi:hypothetical protein